jgi:group I intron endonuclease
MSDTYGYIYITTNKINGNRYIGQHKSKDWDSKYIGSGLNLKKAIKKYGIEKFTCFPLAWAWNEKELNKLEIEYIAHYKPEYNIAKGGQGGNSGNYSEEIKKKISETRIIKQLSKGKNHPLYGKHHSEESRIKMSKSQKGKQCGENNPMFGKHHTEETKQKIREANKGRTHSEEHKRKIGESNKGKIPWNKGKTNIFSEESKRKIRESVKGRIFTNEHRQKLSKARKQYWQIKKGLADIKIILTK